MGNSYSQEKDGHIKQLYNVVRVDKSGCMSFLEEKASGRQYLLKQFSTNSNEQFVRLQTLLKNRQLNSHPQVLSVYDLYSRSEDTLCSHVHKIYMIIEHPFRTLYDQIDQRRSQQQWFTQNELWSILYSCSLGLQHLYQNNRQHQSLSSNRIYIENQGLIKISDPELMKQLSNINSKASCPPQQHIYLSPEQLEAMQYGKLHQQTYSGSLSDVFTLGMIMLEASLLEWMDKSYQNGYVSPGRLHQAVDGLKHYSDTYRDVIKQMVKLDPKDRIKLAQIEKIIETAEFEEESQMTPKQTPRETDKNSGVKHIETKILEPQMKTDSGSPHQQFLRDRTLSTQRSQSYLDVVPNPITLDHKRSETQKLQKTVSQKYFQPPTLPFQKHQSMRSPTSNQASIQNSEKPKQIAFKPPEQRQLSAQLPPIYASKPRNAPNGTQSYQAPLIPISPTYTEPTFKKQQFVHPYDLSMHQTHKNSLDYSTQSVNSSFKINQMNNVGQMNGISQMNGINQHSQHSQLSQHSQHSQLSQLSQLSQFNLATPPNLPTQLNPPRPMSNIEYTKTTSSIDYSKPSMQFTKPSELRPIKSSISSMATQNSLQSQQFLKNLRNFQLLEQRLKQLNEFASSPVDKTTSIYRSGYDSVTYMPEDIKRKDSKEQTKGASQQINGNMKMYSQGSQKMQKITQQPSPPQQPPSPQQKTPIQQNTPPQPVKSSTNQVNTTVPTPPPNQQEIKKIKEQLKSNPFRQPAIKNEPDDAISKQQAIKSLISTIQNPGIVKPSQAGALTTDTALFVKTQNKSILGPLDVVDESIQEEVQSAKPPSSPVSSLADYSNSGLKQETKKPKNSLENYLIDPNEQIQRRTSDIVSKINKDGSISFGQESVKKRISLQNSVDQSLDFSTKSQNIPKYVNEQHKYGSRYEGYKLNDKRHGFGKFYYQDGGYYEGEWKHDKMDGYAKLYYQNGQIAYQGYWKQDQFHGRGKVFNDSPDQMDGPYDYRDFNNLNSAWLYYDGMFDYDKRTGLGTLKLSNGEIFEGCFEDDVIEGPGKFYTIDGEVVEGTWKQSKLVQQL